MLSTNSRNNKIFALVDCNNFYASCEKVFRPDLRDRPIIVLSNNDGNIIARSKEAKALGIGMGEPYFRVRPLLRKHDVQVFSSNYSLYGDMSQRVMDVLRQIEPDVEVYSIDEAFISLPAGNKFDLIKHGRRIQTTVQRSTGIPVSIGFAPTKTLAKLANRIAKKNTGHDNVFALKASESECDDILAMIEVGEVWGIGPKNTQKLNKQGIYTALDLKKADDGWIRKHFTVTGLRTVWELRGISCIPFEQAPVPKKGIVTSKSFGRPVTSLEDLNEAVATYVTRAAEKLRAQHSIANSLHVFFATNRFKTQNPQYSNNLQITLPEPTSSTSQLIRFALKGLANIYRPGYEFQKAGVMLTEIIPEEWQQKSLFAQGQNDMGLMKALDHINGKWGSNTIQYAVSGLKKTWTFKREQLSKAYTTRWDQLPVVKAS